MKRVYRSIDEWEEIDFNMWGEVTNLALALEKVIEFASDYKLYGQYMMRVIKEWPVSCENALTDMTMNRSAWLGQAAVSLALKISEDITRKAWGYLTDEQRLLANEEARRAIANWERDYLQNKPLHTDLEGQMLFKWDS